MYLSDGSSYYETTYSVDQRIEKYLTEKRHAKDVFEEKLEESRQHEFEDYFKTKDDDIFQLPALKFMKFTCRKVKFYFEPSKAVDFVSKKTVFYCTLIHQKQHNYWTVKKDTIPIGPMQNYKLKVFKIFHKNHIEDDTLPDALMQVYQLLVEWSKYEEEFRIERHRRYTRGLIDDLDLDSEDEELFLTDQEKEKLFYKRQAILKRMIPPERAVVSRKNRRVKRKKLRVISSSSESNN